MAIVFFIFKYNTAKVFPTFLTFQSLLVHEIPSTRIIIISLTNILALFEGYFLFSRILYFSQNLTGNKNLHSKFASKKSRLEGRKTSNALTNTRS
jgi:hypothetical protein